MIIHDCVASETHYFAACRLQACQKGWSLSIMSGPFAATSISSSKMPYGAPADVKPTTNMRRPETSTQSGWACSTTGSRRRSRWLRRRLRCRLAVAVSRPLKGRQVNQTGVPIVRGNLR
jgi:hypothetical protein